MKKNPLNILALASICSLSAMAAPDLLLDFGPTPNGNPTLSPAHQDGGITGTSWNILGIDDIAAGGLIFDDGTNASGISLDLGAGNDISAIDFSEQPTRSSALGGSVGGLFSGTTPAPKDGIFHTTDFVAAQILGLSTGTYDVYVTGRNTNIPSDAAQLLLDSGTPGTIFDFGSSITSTFANADPVPSSFVAGQNYGVLRVSIVSGEAMFIAINGNVGNDARGFFNSIEVVDVSSIPESSTYALIVSLCGLGFTYYFRRRQNR